MQVSRDVFFALLRDGIHQFRLGVLTGQPGCFFKYFNLTVNPSLQIFFHLTEMCKLFISESRFFVEFLLFCVQVFLTETDIILTAYKLVFL